MSKVRTILKLINITTPHEKKRLAICAAVRSRRVIKFYYHGISLTVEPYRLGMVLSGGPKNDSLLCYQIRGFISPQETPGWRLYRLLDIKDIKILDEQFEGDRPDYDPNSVYMHIAYCSIFPMPRVETEAREKLEVEPESALEETPDEASSPAAEEAPDIMTMPASREGLYTPSVTAPEEIPNSIPASTIEELTDISLMYAAEVASEVSPVHPDEEITDIEPVLKAEEAPNDTPMSNIEEKTDTSPVTIVEEVPRAKPMTIKEEMYNVALLPAPNIIPKPTSVSSSHNEKMKEFRLNHPSPIY